jgi:hypothetical protein
MSIAFDAVRPVNVIVIKRLSQDLVDAEVFLDGLCFQRC